MVVYTEQHNQIISRVSGYMRGIGESLKNAFVGFVYDPDGSVSSCFAVALSYMILAVSIIVVVAVINLIFKKRR